MAELVQRENGFRVVVRELPGLASGPAAAGHVRRSETDGHGAPLRDAPTGPGCSSSIERVQAGRRSPRTPDAAPRSGNGLAWHRDRGSADRRARVRRLGRPQGTRLLAVDLRTRALRDGRSHPAATERARPVSNAAGTHARTAWTRPDVAPHFARVDLDPFAVAHDPIGGPGDLVCSTTVASCCSRAAAAARASTRRRSTSRRASLDGVPVESVVGRPPRASASIGRLHRAALPSGPERLIRRLPGPNVSYAVSACADQRCPKWWARGSAATTSGVSATRRASAERLSSPETRMLRFRSTRSKRPRASRSGSARTIARCRS